MTLTNQLDQPTNFSHYEYFDINRHQLYTEWVRTGDAAPVGNAFRDELNKDFDQNSWIDKQNNALISSMLCNKQNYPSREEIEDQDYYPPNFFLADLSEEKIEEQNVYTDQNYFFGEGNFSIPQAVKDSQTGKILSKVNAYLQPAMFSIKKQLSLSPNQTIQLSYAFGYLPSQKNLTVSFFQFFFKKLIFSCRRC